VVFLEPPLLFRKVASDVVVEEELREDVELRRAKRGAKVKTGEIDGGY
jgi:hypothetical protein